MNSILTTPSAEKEEWLQQLANVITDPIELLQLLQLEQTELYAGAAARRLFPLRVPYAFAARMRRGDPNDPLLRQVLTVSEEFLAPNGFSHDPLLEQAATPIPGLLHKYRNRVLLLVKGGCAVNCRYCFRRHFPYSEHPGNKHHWQQALQYIADHPVLDEVIFSGGDPLMAKDDELAWLLSQLERITHVQRLRIHTRLPIVIPARITQTLCHHLAGSRLQIVLVTHVNHAHEIDSAVAASMAQLRAVGVTLLNQGVLLKGVNDNVEALLALSYALFNASILPYYLYLLDRVQGAAHFLVDDQTAKYLIAQLMQRTSGYLVPRLVREVAGKLSKVPLSIDC